MSETVQKLLPTLLALPESDRELIAEAMSDSLRRDDDIDPEFLAMLNRRIDDIESGRVVGIPADEVMEEARKRYP
jgi:putative addiction module component (TIGR02574 family)